MNNKIKFNRKKFQQNELNRLQNIHKKPISFIRPIIKPESPLLNQSHILNQSNIDIPIIPTIYKFNSIASTSTNLNMNISRKNDHDKIPKITFKEVPIPHYSETDKFDLNTINSNMSSRIDMDIFASDIINDANINDIKSKGIYKIIHVYQDKYKSNKYPTGFGDFIRGCFFIIQFCSKFDFQYDIIINHPISKFLKNFDSNNSFTSNHNIKMFTETNFHECVYDEENYIQKFRLTKETFGRFLNYLSSLPVTNNSVFSYNILFPYDNITIEEYNKIRFLFEPSVEINDKVNEILTSLSLVKKDYSVLHIRSGDSYLINKNNKFDTLYFETIKDEIAQFIVKNKKNNKNNILLIADNNIIKLFLNEMFPDIKFLVHDITHIGEGVKLQENKLKNTMIDFFLISNASFIFSLTSYSHGTGFSYWCSKIFNIPYECKFITPFGKKNEINSPLI